MELLRAFRQRLSTDSYHVGTIMDHYRHALLKYRAVKTFVRHLAGTARQQTGNVVFHHGPAIELHARANWR